VLLEAGDLWSLPFRDVEPLVLADKVALV